jgi:hypothetical protein
MSWASDTVHGTVICQKQTMYNCLVSNEFRLFKERGADWITSRSPRFVPFRLIMMTEMETIYDQTIPIPTKGSLFGQVVI